MVSNFYQHSAAEGLIAAIGSANNGVAARHTWISANEDSASRRRTDFRIAVRDLHSPVQLIADVIAIVFLSVATGILFHLLFHGALGPIPDFIFTGIVVALLFAGIDRLTIGRRFTTRTNSFERIRDTAESWSLAFAALIFALFALKTGSEMSRGAVLSLYLIGLPMTAVWRVFMPVALNPLVRKAGSASRECIVIGDCADQLIENFAAELQASGHPPPAVVKFRAACLPSDWKQELQSLAGRVRNAARALGPGEVYLCAGEIPSDRLAAIGRTLSVLPRAIFVVPDAQIASLVRCKATSVGGQIALEIRHEPLGPVQRCVKRLMDVALSAVALTILAPFFALLAVIIKGDSKGPVFFRQTRNGYHGKPFRIWKFRSMAVLEDGPLIRQAQRDDKRTTHVGRLLRRSSVDELPQLLNVLLGQMSLVGPRPHAQAHDELYAKTIENYEVRQHVKPGLTGWAQVNGLRGETATLDAMYRRIEYDLWYAVNASILLDIEILVRTIIEVCRQRNAY